MNTQDKNFKIDEDGFIYCANQIDSPNHDSRPLNQKISLIVIHSISLPPNKFGNSYIEDFFTNKLDINEDPYFKKIQHLNVSSHFLIKRKGHLMVINLG